MKHLYKLLFAGLLSLVFHNAKAQNLTITNKFSPDSVQACKQDSFIVKIGNSGINFGSGDTLKINITLPTGIEFVSADNLNTGTMQVINTSDTSAFIIIKDIPKDTVRLIYKIHPECEAFDVNLVSGLFNIVTAYINQNTGNSVASPQDYSYELNTPFLVLNTLSNGSRNLNNTNAPYKQNYERAFVFINTGKLSFTGKALFTDNSVNPPSANALEIQSWSYAIHPSAQCSILSSVQTNTSLVFEAEITNLAPGDTFVVLEQVKVIKCINEINDDLTAYTMNLKYGCLNEDIDHCKLFSNNIASTSARVGGNAGLDWAFVDPSTFDRYSHDEPPYNCPKDSNILIMRLINSGTQVLDTVRLFQGQTYNESLTWFNTSDIKLFTKSGSTVNYINSNSLIVNNGLDPQPFYTVTDSTPNYYAEKKFAYNFLPGDTIYAQFIIRNSCLDSSNNIFKGAGIFRNRMAATAYNECNSRTVPHADYTNEGNYYTFTQNFLPTKLAFDGRAAVKEEAWMKIEGFNLRFDNAYFNGDAGNVVYDPSNSLIRVRFKPTAGFTVEKDSIYLKLTKALGTSDTTWMPVNVREVISASDTCEKSVWADFKIPSYFYAKKAFGPGDSSVYYRFKTGIKDWFNFIDVHFKVKSDCGCVRDPANTRISESFYFVIDDSCASECLVPLAAVDKRILITCPGCVLPGWDLGGGMSIKRLNFGYADNDNDNHPDNISLPPADLAKAKTERAAQGDTIELKINGFLYPGDSLTIGGSKHIGFPFRYSRLRLLGDSSLISALQFVGGDGIYNGNSFTIPQTSGYTANGNDVDLSIGRYSSLETALGTDSMKANDVIELLLRYKIKDNLTYPEYIWLQSITARMDMAGVEMNPVDSTLGRDGTVNVDSTMAMSIDERKHRFFWCTAAVGGYVSVGYSHVAEFATANGGAGYGFYGNCYKGINFGTSLDFGQANTRAYQSPFTYSKTSLIYMPNVNKQALNSFSFEVRDFMQIDSLTTSFPSDYFIDTIKIYEANLYPNGTQADLSSYANTVFTYPRNEARFSNADSVVTIFPADFYQYYMKPYYLWGKSFGNMQEPDSLDLGDETKRIHIEFVLKMRNPVNTRDSVDVSDYETRAYLSNLPGAPGDTMFVSDFSVFRDNPYFYTPKPDLKAEGNPKTVTNVSTDTVTWNLNLKVKPLPYHHTARHYAENTFIIPVSSANIRVDTLILTSSNNPDWVKQTFPFGGDRLYGLGTTAPFYNGTTYVENTINLKVKARFDCAGIQESDSIAVVYGWNCYGYPATLNGDSVCSIDTVYLKLVPNLAGIEASISSDASASPCDTVSYTITFTGKGSGAVLNIKDSVLLPPTLTYVTGSSIISYGTTTAPIPATALGNYIVWDLNDKPDLASNFNTTIKSASLTFKLATSCGYNKEGINSYTSATNYCGKDTTIYLNDKKPGTLTGVPVPSSRKLNIVMDNFPVCDTIINLTVTLANTDTLPTAVNEFFEFKLATGTYYSNTFIDFNGNFSTSLTPNETNKVLSWRLPVLQPGDSLVFGFSVSTGLCGSFTYRGEYVIDTTFTCAPGITCIRKMVAAFQDLSNGTERPANIAGFSSPDSLNCGEELYVNELGRYSCKTSLWNFGDGSPDVNAPEATHTYFTGGIYTITHISTTRCINDTIRKTIKILSPDVFAGNDTAICKGSSVTLTAVTEAGGGTYLWSTGETTQSITVAPTVTTDYIVTYDLGFCFAKDTVRVRVLTDPNLYSPQITSTFLFNVEEMNNEFMLGGYNNFYPQEYNIGWNPGVNDDNFNYSPGSTSFTYYYTYPGYYMVSVKVDNICGQKIIRSPFYIMPNISTGGVNYNYTGCVRSYTFPKIQDVTGMIRTSKHHYSYPYIDYITYDVEVLGTQTWPTTGIPSTLDLARNLIVEEGKTLTLSNMTVRFAPEGKLIVKPGGTLILDNTVLASIPLSCGSIMWQGVEVWGNTSKTQTALKTGTTYLEQGKIIIRNGSVIQDAHNGVIAGKTELYYNTSNRTFTYNYHTANKGGGIIQANNSAFNRNGVGVRFWEYSKTNRDTIRNCLFNSKATPGTGTNISLKDPYYVKQTGGADDYDDAFIKGHNPFYGKPNLQGNPSNHIYAHGVTGVKVFDNTFEYSNKGMFVSNSKMFIQKKTATNGNLFTSHNNGIAIYNTYGSPLFGNSVIGNTFRTFDTAMVDNGGVSDIINTNRFNDNSATSGNKFGIRLNNAASYRVSDNLYNLLDTAIIAYNSGTSASYITYNNGGNNFNRCGTSIATTGTNSRLTIRCNTTDNPNLSNEYKRNWNIRGTLPQQGRHSGTGLRANEKLPAGNRFNNSTPTVNKEIKSTVTFAYFSHSNPKEFIPKKDGLMSIDSTSKASSSFQNSCSPGMVVDNVSSALRALDTIRAEIAALRIEHDNVSAILDNNETGLMLTAISQNTPLIDLKPMLVANSPLSDTVLNAVLAKYSISEEYLKEIMFPNLNASKKVWPKVEDKLNGVTQSTADEIKAKQIVNTEYRTLTAINKDLEMKEMERQGVLNQLISFYADADSMDFAIPLIEQEADKTYKINLASAYIDKGNYSGASLTINALPAANSEEVALKDLYNFNISLGFEGKSIWDLDSIALEPVRTIARMCPPSLASVNAEAMLLLTGEDTPPCDYYERSARMADTETEISIIPADVNYKPEYLGNNIPNPFNSITLIPYVLPERTENAELVIRDVAGRMLKAYTLNKQAGNVEISMKEYDSGVYFYSISINGNTLDTKRMVVIK